ncbi:MAG: alpha/beta hydrolase [Planctomycetaceae bacterium]
MLLYGGERNIVVAEDAAPAREEILLWPNGAPGAIGNESADHPMLTLHRPRPDSRNGCAVIVCPGGGYAGLAMSYEGHDVADWFNTFGVTAFVLQYRHAPRYQHPAPLNDVQRAVRTVRARSAEWKVDPQRIGVLGFSAGGHLTSTAGTHFDDGNSQASDVIERAGCRPDFLVLCYPVISFTTEHAHAGSRRNLLGENPEPALVQSLSSELQVTKQTPPTFLFHTSEDQGVPPENSVLFYLALKKAGVPVEMHIYQSGAHGVGLAQDKPALSSWPGLLRDWLRHRKLLEK